MSAEIIRLRPKGERKQNLVLGRMSVEAELRRKSAQVEAWLNSPRKARLPKDVAELVASKLYELKQEFHITIEIIKTNGKPGKCWSSVERNPTRYFRPLGATTKVARTLQDFSSITEAIGKHLRDVDGCKTRVFGDAVTLEGSRDDDLRPALALQQAITRAVVEVSRKRRLDAYFSRLFDSGVGRGSQGFEWLLAGGLTRYAVTDGAYLTERESGTLDLLPKALLGHLVREHVGYEWCGDAAMAEARFGVRPDVNGVLISATAAKTLQAEQGPPYPLRREAMAMWLVVVPREGGRGCVPAVVMSDPIADRSCEAGSILVRDAASETHVVYDVNEPSAPPLAALSAPLPEPFGDRLQVLPFAPPAWPFNLDEEPRLLHLSPAVCERLFDPVSLIEDEEDDSGQLSFWRAFHDPRYGLGEHPILGRERSIAGSILRNLLYARGDLELTATLDASAAALTDAHQEYDASGRARFARAFSDEAPEETEGDQA